MEKKITFVLTIILIFAAQLWAQTEERKGRNPIIIVPGIMGSKLVNPETNETVWVKFSAGRTDDLRLPVSPDLAANRDKLVATEIVDKIRVLKFLPGVSVYQELLEYLEKKAGYRQANWDIPLSDDDQGTYYVFPYDWRRDNVETAHLLLQKIEKLKIKLKKPELKFDIIAHSMGGLVVRYAAMYGLGDLTEKPRPNWTGARHFNKIFMLGTPNEGAMSAFDTLVNGYWIETLGNKVYPEFLRAEVAFTIPSLFQLLPHGKAAKFYDENLKPLDLDIYDPRNWKKYRWSVISDEIYLAKLKKAERVQAEKYLDAALLRARRFHEALDVSTIIPDSLLFYAFGSDCKNTLDGAIVYFDLDQGKWATLTEGDSFKNIRGEKVGEKLVRQTIFAKGDGSVTKTSLMAENLARVNGRNLFLSEPLEAGQRIVCEGHTAMPNNKKLQESFMEILSGSLAKKTVEVNK